MATASTLTCGDCGPWNFSQRRKQKVREVQGCCSKAKQALERSRVLTESRRMLNDGLIEMLSRMDRNGEKKQEDVTHSLPVLSAPAP